MKLGEQEIQLLNALSRVSRVEAKDCLVFEDRVSFLVKPGEMGKAIGKQGEKIKKLENALNKKIEIVEYRDTPAAFFAHVFSGIRFSGFETIEHAETGPVLVVKVDMENKQKLRASRGKIRRIEELLKRNFGVNSVKIE